MVVKSPLIIDIETIPLNIKDENVTEYLMDKQFTRSLHPVFSKIILIGTKLMNQTPIQFYGEDERKILDSFWEYYNNKYGVEFDKIVTFNGYRFDIPFIYIRSLLNGVPKDSTNEINTNKWRMDQSNHFDCMIALSFTDTFEWVSLETICRQLNIDVPEIKRLTHPKFISECCKKGDWKSLIEYNKVDLELTEQVFDKIKY